MNHDLLKENCCGDICRVEFKNNAQIKTLCSLEKPFILRDSAFKWQAFNKWNLEYLNSKLLQSHITHAHLDGAKVILYENTKTQKSDFIKNIKIFQRSGVDSMPKERIYLASSRTDVNKREKLLQKHELLEDINIPYFIPYNKLSEINLSIDNGGYRSSLHFDFEENTLTVLRGKKTLVLFPPCQTSLLYQDNTKKNKTLRSLVDIFSVNRRKYHLVDKAIYYQTTLSEGESLYIPAGWWYAEESSEDLNVALNIWWFIKSKRLLEFGNPASLYLWQTNFKWLSILKSEFYFYN